MKLKVDIFPAIPFNNLADIGKRDIEFFGYCNQSFAKIKQFMNLAYLLLSKAGHWVFYAAHIRASTFGLPVLRVIFRSTQEKMVRVYACGGIASMADHKAVGYGAMKMNVGESMSANVLRRYSAANSAITIFIKLAGIYKTAICFLFCFDKQPLYWGKSHCVAPSFSCNFIPFMGKGRVISSQA